LRDHENRPIPGFTLEDCDPVGLNQLDAYVSWNRSSTIPAFEEKPVVLHFEFRAAKLYAFEFER
jgi:hypothetical protein